MSDIQEQFSGTMPMREQHAFDVARLQRYMETHVEGFRGPLQVEQSRGGQSCPTYRLTAGSGRYVLRRKPPGKLLPSAHAVDREFRVIRALAGTAVPVARTHVLCDGPGVNGTTFYGMDCVDGRVLCRLQPGDRVRVGRAEPTFKLVEIAGRSYYRTLREKLGWGGALPHAQAGAADG